MPQLLQALRDAGAEVDWLGVVFDESRKHEVMSRCHFGFNLMKPDVCVGLTMKSVDYFRHDLPILNNIPADTAELVDREQVGLNVGEDTAVRVAAMTVEDCLRMRRTSAGSLTRTLTCRWCRPDMPPCCRALCEDTTVEKQILILLAAYKGGRFIRPMVDSILAQDVGVGG